MNSKPTRRGLFARLCAIPAAILSATGLRAKQAVTPSGRAWQYVHGHKGPGTWALVSPDQVEEFERAWKKSLAGRKWESVIPSRRQVVLPHPEGSELKEVTK